MPLELTFVSILGEPGTYCASVYDHVGGDDECRWFIDTFSSLPDVAIRGVRVSHGDPAPDPAGADMFVLGGSYNSVHDDFPWQRAVYRWLDELAAAGKPLLAICGGHQMLAAHHGARVESVGVEPIAGTEAVQLTDAGRQSGLFDRLGDDPSFHFANGEHVVDVPRGARLLATHPRLPCAALAYPGDWYSTQFHPEATAETLGPSWRSIRPELEHRYAPESAGYRLIENFVTLCRRR